jgi:beta-galactosidase
MGNFLRKKKQPLAPGRPETCTASLRVSSPCLWSVETPVLYTLVTTIRHAKGSRQGTNLVRYAHNSLRSRCGLFLNGRHVVLGDEQPSGSRGVGVAVPDALQEYRVNRLKAMGSTPSRLAQSTGTGTARCVRSPG